MRTATIIISAIALAFAIMLAFNKPGIETYLGVAVTLAALLASFFLIKEKPKKPVTQHQEVGDGGFGIQAGRDVKNNDIKNKK